MDFTSIDSTSAEQSPDFNLLVGEHYEFRLKETVRRFLEEHEKGTFVLSDAVSSICHLMQARIDPPLEVIWFYSALNFRISSTTSGELLDRVAMAKNMFQYITSCSASCSGFKSIALLSPVIFEVHKLVTDLSQKGFSFKRQKKVMREIESLVEVMLQYIGVCCCIDMVEDDNSLLISCTSFVDLVRVWMGNALDDTGEAREDLLKLFFPLVSSDILQGFLVGQCSVCYLAAVVTIEAYLLQVCLKFREGIPRQELQKELRGWAVCSITGIQNFYFFETLVRMLLGPSLPVTSLLSSEDELLLRKVLYDAVILVDYEFLYPKRDSHLTTHNTMRLDMARLILIHEAIEFFRDNGDQMRALSYIRAFTRSRFPSELIKWVTSQIGVEECAGRPDGSSPKALLQWLLNLEDSGTKLLVDSISKYRAKLIDSISKADREQPLYEQERKKLDSDLFYIDNKGEEKDGGADDDEIMKDTSGSEFVTTARTMIVTENDGKIKRKKRKIVQKMKNVKYVKYKIRGDAALMEKDSNVADDDLDSEVENSGFDEETEAG